MQIYPVCKELAYFYCQCSYFQGEGQTIFYFQNPDKNLTVTKDGCLHCSKWEEDIFKWILLDEWAASIEFGCGAKLKEKYSLKY